MDRIAKKLRKMGDEIYQHPVQQLLGAEWYLVNGAEIKGLSSAYAALSWLKKNTKELDALLKKLSKKETS
jgi:hypothetical protein